MEVIGLNFGRETIVFFIIKKLNLHVSRTAKENLGRKSAAAG